MKVITRVFLLSLLLISGGDVFANPTGGVVTSGSAQITQPNSSTIEINQSSGKAIINWQTFNIQHGQTTQFNQPNSSSIALNRINGLNGSSSIFGNLLANGQVWLINPAGILFGNTAQVNVAGLLATTSNISNQNFLSGNYNFSASRTMTKGSIVNEGKIHVQQGGLVALVGNNVDNKGVIQAKMGKVVLGGAQAYTLDFDGDQLINFVIAKGPSANAQGNKHNSTVSNSGIINVSGVGLTSRAAKTLVENSINMSGVSQATHAVVRGGTIILAAGNGSVSVSNKLQAAGGTVKVQGGSVAIKNASISTSGTTSGGKITLIAQNNLSIDGGLLTANSANKGGTIKLLGSNIAVTNSTIEANGQKGGGEILIGGNAHGAGPEPNALTTTIDQNTVISANALTNGNGGKVVVWSNNGTEFYGSIQAEGGPWGEMGVGLKRQGKTISLHWAASMPVLQMG